MLDSYNSKASFTKSVVKREHTHLYTSSTRKLTPSPSPYKGHIDGVVSH